ncbi:CrcB family protein [Streptacidiphilus sp. N1-3]|uniref:Fluoride-specific ion channel FluC n=1 Tax=Streptacidiphilus alkalitolerans TaxID=3342712 RepID=A0ABV6X760_9ACTN
MPAREPAQGQAGDGLPSDPTPDPTSDPTPGGLPAECLPLDPDTQPAPPQGRGRSTRQWDVVAVVAVGGGLGSIARYGLARVWTTPAGGFPWATFSTNVLGSLALGLLMVYVVEVWPPSRYRRPFLGVGIIGGFTTFSTYMNETRGLLASGQVALADAYALTSLIAGLAAVWTGIALARRVSGLPVRRGPSRRSQAGRTATAVTAVPAVPAVEAQENA